MRETETLVGLNELFGTATSALVDGVAYEEVFVQTPPAPEPRRSRPWWLPGSRKEPGNLTEAHERISPKLQLIKWMLDFQARAAQDPAAADFIAARVTTDDDWRDFDFMARLRVAYEDHRYQELLAYPVLGQYLERTYTDEKLNEVAAGSKTDQIKFFELHLDSPAFWVYEWWTKQKNQAPPGLRPSETAEVTDGAALADIVGQLGLTSREATKLFNLVQPGRRHFIGRLLTSVTLTPEKCNEVIATVVVPLTMQVLKNIAATDKPRDLSNPLEKRLRAWYAADPKTAKALMAQLGIEPVRIDLTEEAA